MKLLSIISWECFIALSLIANIRKLFEIVILSEDIYKVEFIFLKKSKDIVLKNKLYLWVLMWKRFKWKKMRFKIMFMIWSNLWAFKRNRIYRDKNAPNSTYWFEHFIFSEMNPKKLLILVFFMERKSKERNQEEEFQCLFFFKLILYISLKYFFGICLLFNIE